MRERQVTLGKHGGQPHIINALVFNQLPTNLGFDAR